MLIRRDLKGRLPEVGLFVQSGLAQLFPYSSIATRERKKCVVSGKWEKKSKENNQKKKLKIISSVIALKVA